MLYNKKNTRDTTTDDDEKKVPHFYFYLPATSFADWISCSNGVVISGVAIPKAFKRHTLLCVNTNYFMHLMGFSFIFCR